MKKKRIIIYRLICLMTNMSYIGKTNDFHRRMNEHIVADSHIGNALRKHELDNFEIEFLWEAVSEEEADIVERAAICAYKTRVPNGYNITPGGEGGGFEGHHHSEETIERMRESHIGKHPTEETIEKIKNSMQGKQCSEETIEKMKGNQNSKGKNLGNKYAEGYKHTEEWKQNKSKQMKGNQNIKGEKNGMKNPINVLNMKRTTLINKINKLEKELIIYFNELCPWDGT